VDSETVALDEWLILLIITTLSFDEIRGEREASSCGGERSVRCALAEFFRDRQSRTRCKRYNTFYVLLKK
jgi:hypothetical protein